MKPKFGFNGLGEFVFYRTYSRTKDDGSKESWNDVVKRVVEGTFSIRKDWYVKNHIPWDEDFWQDYAVGFSEYMFNMYWLPPGRGLWAMGSDFVYERGAMALYNCSFTKIENANDYHWLMDCLMNGVGVGFMPVRNDDLITYEPKGEKEYIIPDSREGWCQSVKMLIEAYLYNKPKPKFYYYLIRPSGALIKGFGGTASGPDPLIYLHQQIETFFTMFKKHNWYDSVMLATDICNAIGCCVVAENVRRSAEISVMPINDPTFLDLKNYDKYPYRVGHGWMSNNSVILESTKDFQKLSEIAKRVTKNGEPGYLNKVNMPYARIGKEMNGLKLDNAIGVNPCLVGNTKILFANGQGYQPIKNYLGQDVDVFCIDHKNELVRRKMRNIRLTGYNKKILKVIFGGGEYIRVTENHKFLLKNGEYKEAKNLDFGDQLAVVNRYDSQKKEDTYWADYVQLQYANKSYLEHRLIAGANIDKHVHHKDGNKKNNNIDNLEITKSSEHLSKHSKGENNCNYSFLTKDDLYKIGIGLCKQLGRRFSSSEWVLSLGSKYRKNQIGSFLEFSKKCAKDSGVFDLDLSIKTIKKIKELEDLGYFPNVKNGKIYVNRNCESCNKTFQIIHNRREQSFCSHSCHNKSRDYSPNTKGLKRTFDSRREQNKELQLNVYTLLKLELGRVPLKEEWKDACCNRGITSEISRNSSPFRSWDSLKEAALGHNHRVQLVIEDGYEDVYNGTVDDYHNFIVGGWEEILPSKTKVERGVINKQCGEIPLEGGKNSKEVCNVVETLPTVCPTFETWLKACEYATTYASTVTLLPTHRPETNAVVARNRRIGVSIIDYTGWVYKEGLSKVIPYLKQGYAQIRKTNKWCQNEAGVPESIRVTTVKPGGTVPKLPGKTSGASYPTFHYTKRAIRVAKNDPICPILIEANVPYEECVNQPDYTYIFYFPIIQGPAKPAEQVTLWEQAINLVTLQREWADNAVSNTLYFRPMWRLEAVYNGGVLIKNDETFKVYRTDNSYDEYPNFYRYEETHELGSPCVKVYKYDKDHEEDIIETVLSAIAPLTKSVSLLPHTPEGVYPQMPESKLTKKEYEKLLSEIKPIDWSTYKVDAIIDDEKFCTGDSCKP